MTTLNGLAKRYDVLTVEERFRLSLAARARGDKAEEERLDRGCPRFTYTMADGRYLDRWHGLDDVVIRACGVLTTFERGHAWRKVAAGVGEAYAYTIGEVMLGTPEDGAAMGQEARDAIEAHFNAGPGGDAGLAAFWTAFDAWAADTTGLSGAELIEVECPDLPYTRALVELATWAAGEYEPDAGQVAEHRASLDHVWRRHVRDDAGGV